MKTKIIAKLFYVWCEIVTKWDTLTMAVSIYSDQILIKSDENIFFLKKMEENYSLASYQNELQPQEKTISINLLDRFIEATKGRFKYNKRLKDFDFILKSGPSMYMFGYNLRKGFYQTDKTTYEIREHIEMKKLVKSGMKNEIYFVNFM